jgi:hypothetical protein
MALLLPLRAACSGGRSMCGAKADVEATDAEGEESDASGDGVATTAGGPTPVKAEAGSAAATVVAAQPVLPPMTAADAALLKAGRALQLESKLAVLLQVGLFACITP